METRRTPPVVAGWVFLALGTFFSVPWIPVALAVLILGEPFPLLGLALLGLGAPVVLGVPFLRGARTWLGGRTQLLSLWSLVLGGLWALAGPLSALNFRYDLFLLHGSSADPLGLALVGAVPPVVGLVFVVQAGALWPAGRARMRQWGGWIYLSMAVIQMVPGLVAWGQGQPLLLLSWLVQAAVVALMGAALLERRVQAMGAFFVSLGLLMALLFVPSQGGQVSSLVLNLPGAGTWPVSDAIFPTGGTLAILVAIAAGLGVWQAMREVRHLRLGMGGVLAAAGLFFLVLLGVYYGLSTGLFLLVVLALVLGLAGWQILRTRETNGVLGAILFLFILAFLIWATQGKGFNLTGMLASMLEAATPIALGALSGVWCERSAVINIGIEGMLLGGAFTAVVGSSATGSPFVGLLVGMLTGGLLGALLAVLAIRFKVNQIIAGTAINIFATGATSFLSARVLAENQALNQSQTFSKVALPVLSRIPVVGPVFFDNNLIIYLTLLLVVVTHIILFSTRWGLRSRSVGEHPLAADTLGVNVLRARYINVLIGGLIAGLGGAYFTLGSVGRFDEVMTAGRGFIGLAAMIFGRWTPFGAFASSLIFGFASALQMKMGILGVGIPSEFLLMAPYLATIIVLAGIVGRAVPPAADGVAYEKH